MTELMRQLQPIAEIVGPSAIAASYSDFKLGTPRGHKPGWEVKVQGTYKGARVNLSEKAPTLDDAAAAVLRRLKEALGLS